MSIAVPITDLGGASFEDRTYAKVAWRLIPFLIVCYVVAYLDRVNVGFAKLQMLSDLKFSGKPESEIQNHARKKSGFCDP